MSLRRLSVALACMILALACGSEETGTTSGGAVNDPKCEAWCEASIAPMCTQTASLAECLDVCVEDREADPDCKAEFDAHLDCQTDNGFTCEGGIARAIGDCSATLNALQTCRTSS